MPSFATLGFAPCKVLLVDDEPDFCSVLGEMLEQLGCTVTAVLDGHQALRLGEQDPFPFNLVISDCMMPGLDGVDTLKALRARHPGVKVILSSGHALDHCLRGRVLEACPFLEKPFGFRTLKAVLAQVLEAPR